MKKFVLSAILAVIVFAIPAVAQTTHPEVSQDQVTAKAKPFLGDWNAVSCDPRQPKPYGVRFNIRVDDVNTDNGVKTLPVLRLQAVQGHDIEKPFDFITIDFSEIVANTPDKHFLLFDTTNNSLVLSLTLRDDKNMTVYEEDKSAGIGGIITEESTNFEVEIIAQRGDDAKDQFGYVDSLAKSCQSDEQKPAPKNAAANQVARLQ